MERVRQFSFAVQLGLLIGRPSHQLEIHAAKGPDRSKLAEEVLQERARGQAASNLKWLHFAEFNTRILLGGFP